MPSESLRVRVEKLDNQRAKDEEQTPDSVWNSATEKAWRAAFPPKGSDESHLDKKLGAIGKLKLKTGHTSCVDTNHPGEERVMAPMNSDILVAGKEIYSQNAAQIVATAGNIANAIDFKSIEDNVRSFAESSTILMKALDEVAKLHPFIGGESIPAISPSNQLIQVVAVLAFKAVVTLELKRRANDKKVIALQLQMQDMMSILLQYVPDTSLWHEVLTFDNTKIASRLRP